VDPYFILNTDPIQLLWKYADPDTDENPDLDSGSRIRIYAFSMTLNKLNNDTILGNLFADPDTAEPGKHRSNRIRIYIELLTIYSTVYRCLYRSTGHDTKIICTHPHTHGQI